MRSMAPESMTHVEEEEIKHVLVLPDSTSVMIEVDADFDFYYAASYNSGIHVLDYGNTNTQQLLRVSC